MSLHGRTGVAPSETAEIYPDLFIAGAPRSGTTSLASYLRGHPGVCFSSPKETHYFVSSALDTRLREDPQRHYIERFFPHFDARIHSIMGEGSVTYLYFPPVIENILDFNPDARFIVMLRNPVEMVPSFHARMLFLLEEDVASFEDAWALQAVRAAGSRIPPRCLLPLLLQYSEVGMLGKWVSELLDRVPRSQCLLILHDDFVEDPARIYPSVLEFLGLPHDGREEFETVMPRQDYRYQWLQYLLYKPPRGVLSLAGESDVQKSRAFRLVKWVRERLVHFNAVDGSPALPLREGTRAMLEAHFRSDTERLAGLLGRDLRHWHAQGAGNR